MQTRLLPLFGLAMLASPALAHSGNHGHLDLMSAIAHGFELDHVIFVSLGIVVAVLAYRAGRRAEARAIAKKGTPHDPR